MTQLLPRYTQPAIETDPLETMHAQHEAREAVLKEQIAKGRTPDADPRDLRGIPVIGRGVAGKVNVDRYELQ